MANLRTEYTDVKDIKHIVEHLTVTENDKKAREQILEELLIALTRKDKLMPS